MPGSILGPRKAERGILSWQFVLGTTMGSRDEFRAMLDFAATRKLVPVIDRVFPLAQGIEALRYLETGRQFGKVVLRAA